MVPNPFKRGKIFLIFEDHAYWGRKIVPLLDKDTIGCPTQVRYPLSVYLTRFATMLD